MRAPVELLEKCAEENVVALTVMRESYVSSRMSKTRQIGR